MDCIQKPNQIYIYKNSQSLSRTNITDMAWTRASHMVGCFPFVRKRSGESRSAQSICSAQLQRLWRTQRIPRSKAYAQTPGLGGWELRNLTTWPWGCHASNIESSMQHVRSTVVKTHTKISQKLCHSFFPLGKTISQKFSKVELRRVLISQEEGTHSVPSHGFEEHTH